jgi:hypothetical protein
MKNLSKIVLIFIVLIAIAFGGLFFLKKEKKPGQGSSAPLINEINKIRSSKGLILIQLDENLCAFAMQRATEYKLSKDKESVHKNFEATRDIAIKSSLSGYSDIEESVIIYEKANAPIGDNAIANDFAQKQELPIVLSSKINLGCMEEEPYEDYRYFVFVGASK